MQKNVHEVSVNKSLSIAVYIKELNSFTVDAIPILSLQKSHHEIQKKSPVLKKLVCRSRKSLNSRQISDYNESLICAKLLESKKKWKESAELYIKALEICDDDQSLHKKLFLLEKILNY